MLTALSKEQLEELKEGVEKLSDLLLGQRKEVCTNLEKAPPQEADRLKEIYVIYNQKLSELEMLRRSCNLKSSEEDHKECTINNVEQYRDVFKEAEVANCYYLPGEENRSEKIMSEEFHGRFGEIHGKELEKKVSIH